MAYTPSWFNRAVSAAHRFSQWLTEAPRLAAFCLMWLPFVLVFALARQGINYYHDSEAKRLIQIEHAAIQHDAETTALGLARTYHLLNDLPEALAYSQDVRELLLNPAQAQHTSQWLKLLAKRSEPDLIWVLNRQGVAVASSNYDKPTSLVGTDYSDRNYFKEAIANEQGRQFAVGRRTNTPGLYFSSLVFGPDQQPLGVVATRLSSQQLQRLMNGVNGFITDELGVVIIASDPSLMYLSLPNASANNTPDSQLLGRYKRSRFNPLPFRPLHAMGFDLWQRSDRPGELLLWVQQTDPYTGMTVHVLSTTPTVERLHEGLERLHWWNIPLSLLLAWALATSLVYRLKTLHQAENLKISNQALERLNQELLDQASRDYLTGIPNRRRFSLTLPREIERSRRYSRPLCLAIMDLDHFKQLNDTYGHAAGDAALRHSTALINDALRQSDLLARLGGEEFGLILPETSLTGAEQFVERLRIKLDHSKLSFEGKTIHISMSIGLAQLDERDQHADSLFSRADQALYRAKQQGRNRTALANTQDHNAENPAQKKPAP
ncbi:sensor domain-containing diguanylate cyclase [Atopomonas sediminilitoris]|uniref:sensor domain-containing diguanylate cyclase n=1 Tax=Atopomonas sediminilitoris TaxID=2919919 RepID=UPI001F4F0F0A|nr:sensor domain-containing diguanylate cyclase [Atopomonas sediminilitoris]MCJ8169688.1 diguanylate cyclase [Atopomonas sediminilitoris]